MMKLIQSYALFLIGLFIAAMGVALSCFVLGFGIWVQFRGGVAMLPGEAMNRAISEVTGKRYETVKAVFDVLFIIAAVAIGNIIRLYNLAFDRLTGGNQNAKIPG